LEQRILVQPHRVERFKLSTIRNSKKSVGREERDSGVGSHGPHPAAAPVFAGTPNPRLRASRTTLFAAFNILNGKVIGTCQERHRSREFIRFLNDLERQLPDEQEVHLIMDNYCTHKSAQVQRWLKPERRRRFHSTSGSPDGTAHLLHSSGKPRPT
jgi:hypothetical protein